MSGGRFAALLLAAATVAVAPAGCRLDNDLDDEISGEVSVPLGVLVCAPGGTVQIFGYDVSSAGGIGTLAGGFAVGGTTECAGMLQRDDVEGTVLVASSHLANPEDPDVVAFDGRGAFIANYDPGGPLRAARGIAVTPDGAAVAVGDEEGGVYLFSTGGLFQGELSPGFAFGAVKALLATSGGYLLVADYPGEARIHRFRLSPSGDGTFILDGDFADQATIGVPAAMAELPTGEILVGDESGNVGVFDDIGARLSDFNAVPLGLIRGLAALPDGNVLVLDAGDTEREPAWAGGLLELAPDGSLQRTLPLPSDVSGDDLAAITVVRDVTLYTRSSTNLAGGS